LLGGFFLRGDRKGYVVDQFNTIKDRNVMQSLSKRLGSWCCHFACRLRDWAQAPASTYAVHSRTAFFSTSRCRRMPVIPRLSV